MEIETHERGLPLDLKMSAPYGVSVSFPGLDKKTRSMEPTVFAIVALKFACDVDPVAVAQWLFEKLSSAKRTTITHDRISIKAEFGPLRLAIEKESRSEEKQH
jgi:hypothetical protein